MRKPRLVRRGSYRQPVHYPHLDKRLRGKMEQMEHVAATKIDPELAAHLTPKDWAAMHVFSVFMAELSNADLCCHIAEAFSRLPVSSWEQHLLLEAFERLGFADAPDV